jgi:hypothetical protein
VDARDPPVQALDRIPAVLGHGWLYLNAAGQPACTRCSGIPARFGCGCGREVTAGERGRCWWYVLAGLVTDALAGPDVEIPARLRPLADGLVSMRRPQSGVVWLPAA